MGKTNLSKFISTAMSGENMASKKLAIIRIVQVNVKITQKIISFKTRAIMRY